ncbi:MAG TPA: F0F1 ATP synthase subunit epsilon [Pseudomonadota bacterium]|nr:F0F1 ATP synthase subunit epsilon [Pseudomonadota bacterium]
MDTARDEGETRERWLQLTIVTPLALVLEEEGVGQVRAEDGTGSFGILPGHTDFLTVLPLSVLIYRVGSPPQEGAAQGQERFVGLRGGVLSVTQGRFVHVFAREATLAEDLLLLSSDVKKRLVRSVAHEAAAHKGFARLEGALLHHMTDLVRQDRGRQVQKP